MSGSALHALDHVIVAVRDLERAVRDATRLLGRTPSWRGAHPGAGTANALFGLANTVLELLAPAGEGPAGALVTGHLDAHGEGVLGLAFATADADACAATFAARGLEPAPPRPGLGRDAESGALRRWRTVHLPPARTRGRLLFAIEHQSPAELLPPALPLGEEGAAVEALDHAVVLSPDLEASRRLYGEEGLGLRLALDRRFDARGIRILFFRVGGVTLEVVGRLADEGAGEGAHGEDRFGGLAWRVPDADAARARLAAAGVDVSEVRPGHKPGTRVCTARSHTCGVPTLLIEPAPR